MRVRQDSFLPGTLWLSDLGSGIGGVCLLTLEMHLLFQALTV